MANEVNIEIACKQVFGMTSRQYRMHAQEKGAPPVVKGMVDILQGAKYLIDYYRVLAKGSGSLSLTEERTRLTKEQADKAEKEGKLFDKQLVLKEDVENEAFKKGRSVRDVFLLIPDRYDAILAAESDQNKINAILSKEIRQNLEGLALIEKPKKNVKRSSRI